MSDGMECLKADNARLRERYSALYHAVMGGPVNDAELDHEAAVGIAGDARDAYDKVGNVEAIEERAEKAEAACAAWIAAMQPRDGWAGPLDAQNEYRYIRRPEYERLVKDNPGQSFLDELVRLRERTKKAEIENAQFRASADSLRGIPLPGGAGRHCGEEGGV